MIRTIITAALPDFISRPANEIDNTASSPAVVDYRTFVTLILTAKVVMNQVVPDHRLGGMDVSGQACGSYTRFRSSKGKTNGLLQKS
ncbi:hypothetical protein JOF56_010058 [Kibdelosporangium banguiense]|uniref:Uncharacterized protein n=1 Tax=Kibdelosporangium banguiense TaxID=1365924 RepID=A0ABS4TZ43_9PSEU|nr:hypothetical protein [Kibdelosporangium banguiense]MBP2329673.1 hypothetical protein [Kibdelosporangium banguiense]